MVMQNRLIIRLICGGHLMVEGTKGGVQDLLNSLQRNFLRAAAEADRCNRDGIAPVATGYGRDV